MKRLALVAFAAAALFPAAPAVATVRTCDNVPVMVGCYHWGPNGVQYCTVWVKPYCIDDVSDVLGPITL